MLFTAIALVAFAGTSMANTKEVKKNEVKTEKEKKTNKNELRADYWSCANDANVTLTEMMDLGYEFDVAMSEANAEFSSCMSDSGHCSPPFVC